jgi:hypothetical protein
LVKPQEVSDAPLPDPDRRSLESITRQHSIAPPTGHLRPQPV